MLSYDRRGDGAHTILLLHGFLGSGRNLVSLARRWSEREPRLRLVFPDLSGHGTSPAPAQPTLDDVARDVLSLAQSIGADEPLIIVGHSFGGRTALAMRMLEPTRLERLVLLDIAASPMTTDLGGLENVLRYVLEAPDTVPRREVMRAYFVDRGVSTALTDWVLLNLVQDGDVLRWRFDRGILKALNDDSRRRDLWQAVDAQTTLIYGERSSFVRRDDIDRFKSANADVVAIPDAGHFLHVDAQSALLDCLAKLDL